MNAEELGLAIDRDAEVPLGVQLAWALRARIEGESARAGERLPGLREVAGATGLNVNTVRAVYQRLDQEGLIESRQGSGTFVCDAARVRTGARAIAANAAREALETGVDPRAVAAALYVGPGTAAERGGEGGARRRELREQIAVLERAIGELESEHPGVAPVASAARRASRASGPALLSARELEHVRTALVRRLASVQAAIDEHVIDAAEAAAQAAQKPARRAAAARPAADAEPVRKRAQAKRAASAPKPAQAPPKPARRRRRPVRPAVAEG
jgi:DNA-binding transcriptional regulator YhcF (GntR family)